MVMTAPQGTTVLGLHEGVALAYPLVQYVADSLDVRVLFIKGFVVTEQGLRPPRTPADVDVIVDPHGLDRLIAGLGAYGWLVQPEPEAPRYFSLHSHNLRHPDWPCDIDLHWQYPGFYADAQLVFEILWQGRTSLAIAGQPIQVPSIAGNACVLAVHAMRNPLEERSGAEVAHLTDQLLNTPLSAHLAEVQDLAVRLRAQETLRPWLSGLGVYPLLDDLTDEERWSWNLRIESAGTASHHWWVEFISVAWYRKPLIAARIVVLGIRGSGGSHGALLPRVRSKLQEYRHTRAKLKASRQHASSGDSR